MNYHSFEELEVWQRARRLVLDVYRSTAPFKDGSLRDQMRRAAVSVASNMAEGAARNANPEFQHFIGIAKRSAAELRTQLYLAMDLAWIANEPGMTMVNEAKLLGAKPETLRRSLTRLKPNT